MLLGWCLGRLQCLSGGFTLHCMHECTMTAISSSQHSEPTQYHLHRCGCMYLAVVSCIVPTRLQRCLPGSVPCRAVLCLVQSMLPTLAVLCCADPTDVLCGATQVCDAYWCRLCGGLPAEMGLQPRPQVPHTRNRGCCGRLQKCSLPDLVLAGQQPHALVCRIGRSAASSYSVLYLEQHTCALSRQADNF